MKGRKGEPHSPLFLIIDIMSTKIYGIFGYREVVMHVPVGKAKLPLTFTNGVPARGVNYRAATYVSVSSLEQAMIENSPQYKTGMIKLIKKFGEDKPLNEEKGKEEKAPEEDNTSKEVKDSKKKEEKKVYPKVENIGAVKLILKTNGATADILRSPDAMKQFMEENGIEFPNFSF